MGDFDGDGRADVAAAGHFGSGVGVLLGNGDGTFQPEASYGPDLIPWSVVAGDFDADGRDDLATANSLSFDVSVLLNGPVTTTTTMHVGKIQSHAKLWPDGLSWITSILVRAEDAGHVALPGTMVTGAWDDGSAASCVTGTIGTCVIVRSSIPVGTPAVTFGVATLTNPTHPEHAYDASANHSPNGASDGTSIVVVKP